LTIDASYQHDSTWEFIGFLVHALALISQDLLATACHHPPSAIIFTALCSEEVGFETADTKSNIGTFALALPL
jgi:hypothetical protein